MAGDVYHLIVASCQDHHRQPSHAVPLGPWYDIAGQIGETTQRLALRRFETVQLLPLLIEEKGIAVIGVEEK